MTGEESLSERLARQARELVDTASARTGQLARVGRLQLDILGIQRERDRELQDLGERAMELVRRGECARLESDPIAEPILRRIAELDAERIDRERQIDHLRGGASRESQSRARGRYEGDGR
jgi:hypothetical protein